MAKRMLRAGFGVDVAKSRRVIVGLIPLHDRVDEEL
jgi:hypothetical protein